jgi:hypothetical protein
MRVFLSILPVAVVLIAAVAFSVHGQDNSELEKQADVIAADVAKLRGLKIKHKIARGVMNKSQIRKRLVKRMAQEYTQEELDAEELSLKRMGLLAANVDYQKLVLDLLTDQIAGFYDPWERRLYIAAWPMMGKEVAMAHEIDHALQDQHFDLKKFMAADKNNGDATVARQALVEGDGTALMIEYVYATSGLAGSPWANDTFVNMMASSMTGASGGGALAKAPLFLREGLIFPYVGGLAFVAHFRKLHTWKRIDRMFKKPPLSTEQILHPKKYENGELPDSISIRPVAALSAYEKVYDNVFGELGIDVFLREHKVVAARSAVAAAGWGGDRLVVYTPANHDGAVAGTIAIHYVVMDQEIDAVEYFEALEDGLRSLAGGKQSKSEANAVEFIAANGEIFAAERRGDSVVMVVGANADLTATVLPQVWKSWKAKRR